MKPLKASSAPLSNVGFNRRILMALLVASTVAMPGGPAQAA